MTAGQLVCESVEARRYKKEDCGIAKKKDITPGGFERRSQRWRQRRRRR